MLSDNPNSSLLLSTSGVLGGKHQSIALLRTVTLMVLTQRIRTLTKKRFDAIQSSREVEKEVVEFDRKISIEKLLNSRESLKQLFGHDIKDEKESSLVSNLPFNVSTAVDGNVML